MRPHHDPLASRSLILSGLAAAAAALLIAGCASSPTANTKQNAGPRADAKIIDLQRGMTPAQVEALLGKPAEVKAPDVKSNVDIEVWVYRRNVGSRVDAVAPTMMEEPWVDPLTGILYYLERPQSSERRVDFIEELHLYFASGQLTEANRTVKREYQFSP